MSIFRGQFLDYKDAVCCVCLKILIWYGIAHYSTTPALLKWEFWSKRNKPRLYSPKIDLKIWLESLKNTMKNAIEIFQGKGLVQVHICFHTNYWHDMIEYMLKRVLEIKCQKINIKSPKIYCKASIFHLHV